MSPTPSTLQVLEGSLFFDHEGDETGSGSEAVVALRSAVFGAESGTVGFGVSQEGRDMAKVGAASPTAACMVLHSCMHSVAQHTHLY